MKRRMNKRMAAATLAGAMVLSMNGMAWAADETEIPFSKEVSADLNTYAPNTNFEFRLSNGTGGDKEFADGEAESGKVKIKVSSGVDGGLYFGDKNNKKTTSTLAFDPDMRPENNNQDYNSYIKTGTINVDVDVFEETGVYEYILQETIAQYDGITYDEQKIHIYLSVGNNDAGNGKRILSFWATSENDKGVENTATKLDGLNFINKYGYNDTEDKIHEFKVMKIVSGNQGEKTRDFNFTITIDGDDTDKTDGGKEKYKVVKKTIEVSGEETIETIIDEDIITDATAATFTLQHNQILHIYGLSEKDTYTVIENDANADGYTTDVTGNATGSLTDDETTVVFENNKNVGPATGVAMTFAPYVLLVAAAGGLGAVVLGKKKREDDEI